MRHWSETLHELRAAGAPCVLVTVLATRGSTPREAGCKMLVTADAAHGTIGGGNLEFVCIARARELLAAPPAGPLAQEFPLGPALGQCCGGHASVLFEVVAPPAWRIAVYGAGHVGRALVALLGALDCRVTWIDARAGAFPATLPPNVRALPECAPTALPAGTFALVLTHDHALDFALVAEALPLATLPFVGLIGSETKRARFVSRLARAGLPAAAIRRLACPIGLPGVGGKAPAEIAVSVAAQLLLLRNSATVADAPGDSGLPGCARCAGCVEGSLHVA